VHPDETLLVGDSPVDLQTAREAKVRACAVAWGFVDRLGLESAGADWIIEHPRELLMQAPGSIL
jgi:phosphoglycolate phosphatase